MRKQQPALFVLIVCIFSIPASCVLDVDDPQFANFIARMVTEFHELAAHHGKEQYAVVMTVSDEEVNQWGNVRFNPADEQGHPVIDFDSPYSPLHVNEFGNFLVAIPDEGVHSEQQIVPYIRELYDLNHPVGAIIIYSRICPCTFCTDCIVENLLHITETPVIVLYTTPGTHVPDVDPNYSYNEFIRHNIRFQQIPDCIPQPQVRSLQNDIRKNHTRNQNTTAEFEDDTCSDNSLQNFLLLKMKSTLGSCVVSGSKTKAVADFINRVFSKCFKQSSTNPNQCDPQNKDLATCSKEVVSELVNSACEDLFDAGEVFADWVKQALKLGAKKLHVITVPLNVNNPEVTQTLASSCSDLSYTRTATYPCSDRRKTGVLCSSWNDMYKTAGNSICRSDHPCDYYGYAYSWCYLEDTHQHKWEYCCTSECDANHRCKSGNTWEHCGNYEEGEGLYDINGHRCLSDYPCGKHADYGDAYYCFYDSNYNWDYCCAPGQNCTNGHCYIGDGDTYKRACV